MTTVAVCIGIIGKLVISSLRACWEATQENGTCLDFVWDARELNYTANTAFPCCRNLAVAREIILNTDFIFFVLVLQEWAAR